MNRLERGRFRRLTDGHVDPYACSLHESDVAWDRQWLLMPEDHASKGKTRHRRR